ncbi:MAG: hypothetical protein H0W73_09680 [Bacteroidetes bacterium]|nr:hypothetical protein [Bacteroidota bacterium]
MSYSKVQFISWELNTGPVVTGSLPSTSPLNSKLLGWYPGYRNNAIDARIDVLSQCIDIKSRISFTDNAISKAYAVADQDPGTLKVFMAPEFLYRGAGGAYIHDLINGWSAAPPAVFNLPNTYNKWGGLFGGLQQIAANNKYNDWVFVFGTAISASYPTYKYTDGKYYLDYTKVAEAYNTSLIQAGGSANTATNYASTKHYISHIDFLTDYINYFNNISDPVKPLDPRSVQPSDILGTTEGGAVFNLSSVKDVSGNPIKFGIEICLDHAQSGDNHNQFGRIKASNETVKIQLVPSGGLNLLDGSISLVSGANVNAYAFNCDGANSLPPLTSGCHTQIWNGNGSPVAAANKLIEASNGAALNTTTVVKVTDSVSNGTSLLKDTIFWKAGSGNVRVMHALPL